MTVSKPLARELSLAFRFAAVSMIGFLVDYGGMEGGIMGGLSAPAARLISLAAALQVTFVLSRGLVFGRRGAGGAAGEWWRFMLANGLGCALNYTLFVILSASRQALISRPTAALLLSASVAYVLNYAGARLFVYGRPRAGRAGGEQTSFEP